MFIRKLSLAGSQSFGSILAGRGQLVRKAFWQVWRRAASRLRARIASERAKRERILSETGVWTGGRRFGLQQQRPHAANRGSV